MDIPTPAGGSRPLRPDQEPYNLGDALRGICDQVRSLLGWRIVTLLLNDETTGLCCLLAASGIPLEVREILVGAAISGTDDLVDWLETKDLATGVCVLDHFGAGSPLGIETLIGHTEDANGYAAVLPVRVRGRAVGFLAVYSDVGAPTPDPERLRALELVTGAVGELIDQSTSAERATRRLENGQLLARLSNRILHHKNFDQILDVTIGDLFSHLEADLCAAYRTRGGRLEVVQESARPQVTRRANQLPVAIALGSSRQRGVSVFDEGDGVGGYASSMLIAPIHVRDELHAVIVCASLGELRHWQPYETELMRGIADQLGLALSEAWLQAEQEGSRRDLESLLAASRALAQANDLDAVLGELLQLAESAVSCESCAVLLPGEPANTLRVLAHRGCPGDVDDLRLAVDGASIAAESMRGGATVVAPDQSAGVDRFALNPEARSAVAVPLRLADSTLGVLVVESTRDRAIGDREARLCGALAHEAAVAIHRTQLFDRVALGKREWETTFDAMADGVFLLDRDGRVVRANRAAGRLFGFEPNDLRGATCCSLMCDRTARHECLTRGALDEGAVAAAQTTIGDAHYDLTLDAIRNRVGTRTGAVAVMRRSDRAQHADDVDVSVARAFARSASMLVLLDPDGLVRWANEAAESLFGDRLVPLVHVANLFAENQRSRVHAALASARGGKPATAILAIGRSERQFVASFDPSTGSGDARVIVLHGTALPADTVDAATE